MLKAQKKISKKQLKRDALLDSMARATSLYEDNKKTIHYALGALIVLIIGAYAYTQNRATKNEEASAKLGSVYSFYDQNQYQLAIDGVPERKITGLKSIVEEYGGTDAGNLARFYLANAYFQLGKYDEALENFDDFDAGEPYLQSSRYAGIAGCYEARNEHEKSAEFFEKAASASPKDPDAPTYVNNAAYNFMLSGKKERALELFKKLKREYPTSQLAREADRYIERMTEA